MLFVVVIPTAEYEQQILYGVLLEETPSDIFSTSPPKISNMDKHIGNRPAARVNPTGKPIKAMQRVPPRNPVMLRSGKVVEEIPFEKARNELQNYPFTTQWHCSWEVRQQANNTGSLHEKSMRRLDSH
ncbi:hypothetical protein RUM44_002942 [Polyplax serrata]|uniref:Uncharacterized protein n=1 Tax=Polyplax serrata TaxID=468196 RepID=A0ABR1AX41_POLSC